ncbi:hypothetical protein IWW42_001560 [Coemansia sp. RSA 1085]|nr:hypothetical protein LPJ68_005684 [Coemansia sp. RSA 1086]KAJ2674714.1 hypothetical protein IWW42_001560 [Coemansia sp. RSA 1085]
MDIGCRDDAGRQHSVVVNFETSMFSSDIESTPVSMETIGLEGYLDRLEQKSKQLAESWDLLDDVDATLCVLQPQRAKRHELWRRIAVSDVCTAMLEVSPERTQPPKIAVYGPHSQARALSQHVKARRHLWRAGDSVRVNLERVLQLTLPEPQFEAEMRLECGICFAFMSDEGVAADQLCSSETCAQPFHNACLAQWLAAKEDTRQSFRTLFGRCPYCGGGIAATA